MPEYKPKFKIFKPRKDGGGAASQWEFNLDKKNVFVEFALQNKDEKISFDWENKSIMKLSQIDIGEILATLTGLQKGIGQPDEKGVHRGLYHQTEKGNTILQLSKNKSRTMYYIRLSQKRPGQDLKVYQHAITLGEASLLTILLRRAIETIYGW